MISSCGDYALAAILATVQRIITFIQIIAPILLLVTASIQLIRLVINPELKGGVKNIINKFIAAAVIFFIPVFVNVLMGILDSSFQLASCYQAARTINSAPATYVSDPEENRQNLFETDYEKGVKKDNSTVSGNYSKNVSSFMMAVENTVLYAKSHNYKYGDSHATPPTTDGIISCDRLAAKALWDIGYTDQRQGGEVVTTLDSYLTSHGWKKSTNISDCKYGSIVLVSSSGTSGSPYHAFVVYSYNSSTGAMKTFDEGAQWRISADQPFDANWTQASIYGVYNME